MTPTRHIPESIFKWFHAHALEMFVAASTPELLDFRDEDPQIFVNDLDASLESKAVLNALAHFEKTTGFSEAIEGADLGSGQLSTQKLRRGLSAWLDENWTEFFDYAFVQILRTA